MPSHWVPMPEDAQVMYVELPLPPGCSPATSGHTRLPGPPPLDQATLKAMVYQVCKNGTFLNRTSVCAQTCLAAYENSCTIAALIVDAAAQIPCCLFVLLSFSISPQAISSCELSHVVTTYCKMQYIISACSAACACSLLRPFTLCFAPTFASLERAIAWCHDICAWHANRD